MAAKGGSAGVGRSPLRDEAAIYVRQADALRRAGGSARIDPVAFSTAFQVSLVEGIEVVFIVVAIGASDGSLILPASAGAALALLLVVALGMVLRRPLARIPENTIKFAVGVLLCAFGTFWIGEGAGLPWPGGTWFVAVLNAGYLCAALLAVRLCRRQPPALARPR